MNNLVPCPTRHGVFDEVERLNKNGFSLIPLGGGKDGKSPSAAKWGQRSKVPISQTLGIMHGRGVKAYGVRLGGYAVIDLDECSDVLSASLEARFGRSPVQVQTPRGVHLYYRNVGPVPNLRKEGLPVDIKTGVNAYVAGPLSMRKDGGTYTPIKGVLGETKLPFLDVQGLELKKQTPLVRDDVSKRIELGGRHDFLVKEAIRMVETVDSETELRENLTWLRDETFDLSNEFSDSEVAKVGKWAWQCRLEGRVYHGRNSEFRVNRSAKDLIMGSGNYSDAMGLYLHLSDLHGHIAGKSFALVHEAMRNAGHTDLSRDRFRRARDTLCELGLLTIAQNHCANRNRRQYRLVSPTIIDAVASNLAVTLQKV
jgi:hypothetical protein